MKRGIRPLFPFGYGLSYTKFEIKDIRTNKRSGRISVRFSLINSGKYDGKAVVQLYASKTKPVTPREKVALVGFAKPLVKAGSSLEACISFDKEELSYFDEEYDKFLLEQGRYDLFLSIKGVEDLIPAGNIYIGDGSEELKCGPSWTCGRIAGEKDLFDALRKDCEEKGLDIMEFVSAVRYTPFKKLFEVYTDTGRLTNFNKAAGEYIAI